MPGRPLTDDDRRTIAAMYVDGVYPAEIGRRVGRACRVVTRCLKRAGLYDPARPQVRQPYRVPAHRLERALYLYQHTDHPLPTIRRATGVSTMTLYAEVRRRGVPHRRPALSEVMRRAGRERHAKEKSALPG